jgi:4-amino-4-deoxy-L-arabinose transferase-like glycosyltransferase
MALALVIRVAVVVATPHYAPSYDARDYVRHAESIAAGHGFPSSYLDPNGGPTAYRPPGFPYFLAAIFKLAGDAHGVTAGRLANAVLGAVIVGLIWLIGRQLWDARVGLVAAALAAVWPPLFMLNSALMSEALFVTLELAVVATALAARARRGDWRWAALCGLFCGLATLTRSNGILVAVPAVFGVWVVRSRFTLRGLRAPAVLALVTVLTIVPWTIRNASAFHQLVPVSTQSGDGLAGFFNHQAANGKYVGLWVTPEDTARYRPIFYRRHQNEAQLDTALRSSALQWGEHHLGYAVEGAVLNVLRMLSLAPSAPGAVGVDDVQLGLSPTMAEVVKWCFLLSLPLTLLGIVMVRRRPEGTRGAGFIWFVPILLLPALGWVVGITRYRVPAYPFMMLLIAVGLVELLPRRHAIRHTAALDA